MSTLSSPVASSPEKSSRYETLGIADLVAPIGATNFSTMSHNPPPQTHPSLLDPETATASMVGPPGGYFLGTFKSKTLESLYHGMGSFSFWLSLQKMLQLACLFSALSIWSEIKNITALAFDMLFSDRFLFEVSCASIFFFGLSLAGFLTVKHIGPLKAEYVGSFSVWIACVFIAFHLKFRLESYVNKYNQDVCGKLAGAIEDISTADQVRICREQYYMGTNQLQLNTAIGAAFIIRSATRNIKHMLLIMLCCGGLFISNISFNSGVLHWPSLGLLFHVLLWSYNCYFNDQHDRALFWNQMYALHKLQVYIEKSSSERSILNHMIKNMAIGVMEDVKSLMSVNGQTGVISKHLTGAEMELESLVSTAKKIVMRTHFAQMISDIRAGRYQVNVGGVSIREIYGSIHSSGFDKEESSQFAWSLSDAQVSDDLRTYLIDMDLVTLVMSEATKGCAYEESTTTITYSESKLSITNRVSLLEMDEKGLQVQDAFKSCSVVAKEVISQFSFLKLEYGLREDEYVVELTYFCDYVLTPNDGAASLRILDGSLGVGVDDSLVGRKLLQKLFHKLGLSKSSFTLGDEVEEVSSVVDALIDRNPALIFLDQHIERRGGRAILGSQIALELRRRGYQGFVAIVSADSGLTQHEQAGDSYNIADAVDCFVGKHLTLEKKANIIATAYAKRSNE